jgi:hypothetical protein
MKNYRNQFENSWKKPYSRNSIKYGSMIALASLLAMNSNDAAAQQQTPVKNKITLSGKGVESMKSYLANPKDKNSLDSTFFVLENTNQEGISDINKTIDEIYADKDLSDQEKFDIAILISGGWKFKKACFLRVMKNEKTKSKYKFYRAIPEEAALKRTQAKGTDLEKREKEADAVSKLLWEK